MWRRLAGALLAFTIASGVAWSAAAQDDHGCPNSGLGEDGACDHFELTMGFLAGARRYDQESFALSNGDVAGAGGLVDPFRNAPYDYVPVYGLRYDLRLVVSYVRMTVGVDFPFAQLQPDDSRVTYDVGGAPSEIVVRKIRPYELRFGIGGEYPIGRFAPFVDLIGEVDWVKTEMSIAGEKVEYKANSFGFSGRAGVRVYLRDWFFIAAAGEIGIVGNRFWGAELSLGFAFG
jgi:hypothetical protein